MGVDFASLEQKHGARWRSLTGCAHNNKFGMQMPLPITGEDDTPGPDVTIKLFDLSREIDNSSSDPSSLAVSLDLVIPDLATITAELRVYADVRWSTGSGTQDARIDIPARGTVINVVAGDGLSIDVTRVGSSAGRAMSTARNILVRGTVGFSSGGVTDAAQLTLVPPALDLQGAMVTMAVPKFARGVKILGPAGAPLRLEWYADAGGGVTIATVTAPFMPDWIESPVPSGALFWSVFGAAGDVPRAIFDLAL